MMLATRDNWQTAVETLYSAGYRAPDNPETVARYLNAAGYEIVVVDWWANWAQYLVHIPLGEILAGRIKSIKTVAIHYTDGRAWFNRSEWGLLEKVLLMEDVLMQWRSKHLFEIHKFEQQQEKNKRKEIKECQQMVRKVRKVLKKNDLQALRSLQKELTQAKISQI